MALLARILNVLPPVSKLRHAQFRRHGEGRENLVAWLIGLRWIAVFSAAAVVGVATLASNRVDPKFGPYLWAGVLALAAFNAVLGFLGSRQLAAGRALVVQVAGDVIALGWLVHGAGGLQNPFSGFFVFHAAIAAVVLEARQARRVAVAIGGFVLALALVESTVLPPGCLLDGPRDVCSSSVDWMLHLASGGAVAVFVVGCAFIVSALVEVLQSERERLRRTSAALEARTADLAAAQTLAQERHERLQMIVDCMRDAVLYVTADGTVRLRNRAAEALWHPDELSAADLKVCHPRDRWNRFTEKFAELIAEKTSTPMEAHPVLQMNGRFYEASYARVADTSGTSQGIVWVARDVTERIEMQQRQVQAERMAVVGKLAAALAHELNNPLGTIALFTQYALAELKPGDAMADYLGTALRNVNLCKKIVRDLLEYAHQRPPERRDVAIEDLLADVVRTLEPQAQTFGVTIRCEFSSRPGMFIYGDPDQMRQIFVNLGLNSIEAMPAGGHLTFRLTTLSGGSAQIEVIDTGTGIPPEEHERIFAVFHTTKPEGTGFGLAVARDFVAAHGGAIAVDSAPGLGSTFTVTLPAVAARMPAAEARL